MSILNQYLNKAKAKQELQARFTMSVTTKKGDEIQLPFWVSLSSLKKQEQYLSVKLKQSSGEERKVVNAQYIYIKKLLEALESGVENYEDTGLPEIKVGLEVISGALEEDLF